MKLSTKGRYGVKAMVYLALNHGDNPISIKEIAKTQLLSVAYLEQLFSPLRKSGLIKSIRGAQGGYKLAKDPSEITVADIMDILEGPIEVSDCLDGDTKCERLQCCATRNLWIKIKDSIDSVTNSITLEDLVKENNELNSKESEKFE